MGTVTYRLGESGELGFPVDDPFGVPMPSAGLAARMVVERDGPDLIVMGRWSSGEIAVDRNDLTHPSIMTFDVTPATFPLPPRVHRAVLQVDDGVHGWRTLPGGDFHLDIRRL